MLISQSSGAEERHDGDSMLRAGEEGLFEMLADQNIETLNKYEFDLLLTTDPHAYNSFVNEYPARGGRVQRRALLDVPCLTHRGDEPVGGGRWQGDVP